MGAMRCEAVLTAIGVVAALGLATPAAGFEIGPESYRICLGRTDCDLGAARLRALGDDPGRPARFTEQDDPARGGVRGLGVAHAPGNGFNDPELQGPVAGGSGERIEVSYPAPQRVRAITIAHLFNPEHIDADPTEEAIIEGFLGAEPVGTIVVTSLTDRSVQLIGPGGQVHRSSTEAGVIDLAAPFAGVAVDRLVFSAPGVPAGDSSDYSIARILTDTAPD